VSDLTALVLFVLLLLVLLLELRRQHQELMDLLNDLATMVGEWLEEQQR
jgi:hypothetical protein